MPVRASKSVLAHSVVSEGSVELRIEFEAGKCALTCVNGPYELQAAAKAGDGDKKAAKAPPKPKKERPAHWKEGQKQELTPPFEVKELSDLGPCHLARCYPPRKTSFFNSQL